MITQNEILLLFKETHALLDGHFQLTSGLHSPQYFQCARVLQYPEHATSLCGAIARQFRNEPVEVVVSPAMGGIIVGQEVGRHLGKRAIFAERKDGRLQLRRGFQIARGEKVLVCEDVITTGGSVKEVVDIVKRNGGIVLGVGAIVDRSGGKVKFDDQYSTMTMEVIVFGPEDCPLCKQGIPIEKPGSRNSK